MRRHSFRAMGTDVEFLVDAEGAVADVALASAEAEVRRLEEALSRFDPRSELSRLNRLGRRDGHQHFIQLGGRIAVTHRVQPQTAKLLVPAFSLPEQAG